MNEVIIRNHNIRVKDEDTVFFLGDFCFRNSPGGKEGEGLPQKAEHFINQLKGHIVFIKGNHDRNNSLKTNIERVIIRYGGHRICLVHNPIHTGEEYEYNFVGHVHEKWKFKRNTADNSYMMNVGVDVWGYMPVSYEEIMKDFRKWKYQDEKTQTVTNEDLEGGEKTELQSEKVGRKASD